MYYDKLKEQLFLELPYPEELTEIIGDGAPWREFCKLPLDVKEKFNKLPNAHDSEAGYQLRSKAAGREDKEYFHFYPHYAEQLKDANLRELVKNTPALESFFSYGDRVHKAVVGFSNAFSAKLGEELPELRELLQSNELQFLLRFLHYTSEEESIIAAQHFDRSIYTLHLYESAPGLQLLDRELSWQDAPIQRGTTVLFNGYRIERMTNGELQKTWHRVVGTSGNRNRISMVLFLWSPKVPDYPKDQRSQDQIPSYRKDSVV